MFWITRERPVIDRIACPWLIRRQIDPAAQFVFVPPADVLSHAAAINGVSFDTPGARFEHDGALCTFDVMIREYRLDSDPALLKLASIVRAADTDHLDDIPQAAGLLALSFGLREVHGSDHDLIHAGMAIYDALYAWCRLDNSPTHNWVARQGT